MIQRTAASESPKREVSCDATPERTPIVPIKHRKFIVVDDVTTSDEVRGIGTLPLRPQNDFVSRREQDDDEESDGVLEEIVRGKPAPALSEKHKEVNNCYSEILLFGLSSIQEQSQRNRNQP